MSTSSQKMNVILHVKETTTHAIIHSLIQNNLFKGHPSKDEIERAVSAREAKFPTYLGDGIMMPHTRVKGLNDLYVTLGILDTPLALDTPDNLPIKFVVLVLIPEDKPMVGLRFMADFSHAMLHTPLKEHLLSAPSEEHAYHILLGVTRERPSLTAADLILKNFHALTPEMPLKLATTQMMDWGLDTLPVVEDGKLAGEISCDMLFKLGIPNFFSQLQSVGFIRQFDPFEAYFHNESLSLVRDVMDKDVPTFPLNTTLIEIVFEISVHKLPVLYIVDSDNKLVGIINRNRLLQSIINF